MSQRSRIVSGWPWHWRIFPLVCSTTDPPAELPSICKIMAVHFHKVLKKIHSATDTRKQKWQWRELHPTRHLKLPRSFSESWFRMLWPVERPSMKGKWTDSNGWASTWHLLLSWHKPNGRQEKKKIPAPCPFSLPGLLCQKLVSRQASQ